MNLMSLLGDAAAFAANPALGLVKVALDVAPDIAGFFGDDAENAVGKIAGAVKVITGTDDPAKAREVLTDPNLVAQLRGQAQAFAHAETMARINGVVTMVTTAMVDVKDARARDVEIRRSGKTNIRANVMLLMAFIAVTIIYAICAYFGEEKIGALVVGSMLTTAGMFAQKIGTAFDFEFGSSRDAASTRDLLAQQTPSIGGGK